TTIVHVDLLVGSGSRARIVKLCIGIGLVGSDGRERKIRRSRSAREVATAVVMASVIAVDPYPRANVKVGCAGRKNLSIGGCAYRVGCKTNRIGWLAAGGLLMVPIVEWIALAIESVQGDFFDLPLVVDLKHVAIIIYPR